MPISVNVKIEENLGRILFITLSRFVRPTTIPFQAFALANCQLLFANCRSSQHIAAASKGGKTLIIKDRLRLISTLRKFKFPNRASRDLPWRRLTRLLL
jgi:hypothetical protein